MRFALFLTTITGDSCSVSGQNKSSLCRKADLLIRMATFLVPIRGIPFSPLVNGKGWELPWENLPT